jgi:hypothetical protein
MIQPTIGRRVWYWPSALDLGLLQQQPTTTMTTVTPPEGEAAQPCDAGVCFVHDDRTVNLSVADHDGVQHIRQSVTLVQEGDTPPEGAGYATWMPYQINAAKGAA